MSPVRLIADRFEIKDPRTALIGRGGMGTVYRGVDLQTGKAVAIKQLLPDIIIEDPRLVERFNREGQALRQLNHPNIVKMVTAVEEAGEHYLVLEYVTGGSLRDLIDDVGPLQIGHVVEIALDLADALTRAHRLGIIHRDLKPANVLIAEDGTPRLTDFGIARFKSRPTPLTKDGALIGTAEYLSPEMCNGEEIDERTDIWAMGVILYEMLTGRKPFSEGTVAGTLVAIVTQPTPDLDTVRPGIPDALADLVYRMLEKDKLQRIPSVRLVGAELEDVLRRGELKVDWPEYRRRSEAAPQPPAGDVQQTVLGRPFAPSIVPSGADAPKHNLPAETTPFVGRKQELNSLGQLIADSSNRLVTIVGPGGMGKTRLALEAAHAQLNNFEYGPYFVSLAPLKSSETMLPAVAQALHFSFYAGGEPKQQLLDFIRNKQMLIVMDNFEHLIDGASLVADMLEIAPDLQVIATSRERLKLQHEQVFYIRGLDYPNLPQGQGMPLNEVTKFAAVQLFVQSARRSRPDFELAESDVPNVARICRMVEGMPLAIVLAAAWVEVLSLSEIAAEMSAGLGRSLDFLQTEMRDVPESQRSVRVVFDYAWRRLSEREKTVFSQLSVCRGGFTRTAAQKVVGASLRELMNLVNKALVFRDPEGRYQVHELLRQYAAGHLVKSRAGEESVRDRHAEFYCRALERLESDLKGDRVEQALREIEIELENARAAWDWAVSRGQIELVDGAAEALGLFYWLGVRAQEGEAAFRTASLKIYSLIKASRTPPRQELKLYVKLMVWYSIFSRFLGQNEAAERLSKQAIQALEKPELRGEDVRAEMAAALLQRGRLAYFGGQLDEARQYDMDSLSLYRQLGDRWGEALTLSRLGWVAINSGAYAEAHQFFQASLRLYRALGNKPMIATMLVNLGQADQYQGDLEVAEKLIREGLEIYQETGFEEGTTNALFRLAETSILLGKFEEAKSLLDEVIERREDQGHLFGLAYAHVIQAHADLHLGRYEEAGALAETSLRSFTESRSPWGIGFCHYVLGCVALADGSVEDAQTLLRKSVSVNREIGQRDELSWSLACLSYAERALGFPSQAQKHLQKALQTGLDIQAVVPLLLAVPSAALLIAELGDPERAVELYTMAQCHAFVAGSRWFEDVAGRDIEGIEAELQAHQLTRAKALGRSLDIWTSVAGLLESWEENG